jgi:hypothetical protein
MKTSGVSQLTPEFKLMVRSRFVKGTGLSPNITSATLLGNYRLRNNSVESGLVTGHDFSRADKNQ